MRVAPPAGLRPAGPCGTSAETAVASGRLAGATDLEATRDAPSPNDYVA